VHRKVAGHAAAKLCPPLYASGVPSAFAHFAVGASLAVFRSREKGHRVSQLRCAAVLGAIAAAPDLDVIGFRLDIAYGHPLGHRGFTHSFAFAAMLALASAPLWRWALGGEQPWVLCSALSFFACLSHGLLDAFTDAGLGVGFALPFDENRYFFRWRPLMTSPVSATAFFGARGLRILANEAFWIGPPTLALLAFGTWLRRRKRSDSGSARSGASSGDTRAT